MTTYTSQPSELEFKVREEGSLEIGSRMDKDDRKAQAAEARAGRKDLLKDQILEPTQWGTKEGSIGRSADLPAPVTHETLEQSQISQRLDSGLFSPPIQSVRPVHHTSAADFSFSSIPDSKETATLIAPQTETILGTKEEVEPLLKKQESSSGLTSDLRSFLAMEPGQGDPLPSEPALMEEAGEKTGAALDSAVSKAKESIQKARSLYSLWKDGEKKADSSELGATIPKKEESTDANAPSAMDKAKTMYSNAMEQMKPKMDAAMEQAKTMYTEQVLPGIEAAGKAYTERVEPQLMQAKEKVIEQVGILREEGFAKTDAGMAINNKKAEMAPKMAEAKTKMADTQTNVRSQYEARVPLRQRKQITDTKGKIMLQMRAAKDKLLDIWEGEEPTVRAYTAKASKLVKDYKLQLPLMILGGLLLLGLATSFIGWMAFPKTNDHLPVLYTGSQPIEHMQHASNGPLQDVPNAGLGDKMKMKLNSADDVLREKMGTIRDSGAEQLRGLKDAIPSMDMHDIKLRTMDAMHHATDAVGSVASNAGAAMGNIGSQQANLVPSTNPNVPAHQHVYPTETTTAPASATLGSKMADLKDGIADRVQDRLHHLADAIPTSMHMPTVAGIQEQAIDLKNTIVDKLTPSAAPSHPQHASDIASTIDPESHVKEAKVHGHVEEYLDL